MEMNIEDYAQKYVLEAIEKVANCTGTEDAARFAAMNRTVYAVAMEAVKNAVGDFAK